MLTRGCSAYILQKKWLTECHNTKRPRGKEFVCFPRLRSFLTPPFSDGLLLPGRSVPGCLPGWGTLQQEHLKYSLVFCSVLWVAFGVWVLRVSASLKARRVWGKVIGLLLQNSWWNYVRKKLFNLILYLYMEPLAWIQPVPYTPELQKCVKLSITPALLVGIACRTLLGARFSTLQNGCFIQYLASLFFILTSDLFNHSFMLMQKLINAVC